MEPFNVGHVFPTVLAHLARSRPASHWQLTAATPHVSNSTVFVGNLSWGTTSEDLRAFMSALGEVVSAEVQSHADSGRSKGWG